MLSCPRKPYTHYCHYGFLRAVVVPSAPLALESLICDTMIAAFCGSELGSPSVEWHSYAGVAKPGQRRRIQGPVSQEFLGSNPIPRTLIFNNFIRAGDLCPSYAFNSIPS